MAKYKNFKSGDQLTQEEEEFAKKALENSSPGEDWETGKLGRDPEHMVVSNSPEKKTVSLKSVPVTLINDLKHYAEKKHMGYQTLIKMLVQEWVDSQKEKDKRA